MPTGTVTLAVDVGRLAATWTVDDVPATFAGVRSIVAPEVLEPVLRRAVSDIRAAASSAHPPATEALRRLAATLWRDYSSTLETGRRQDRLPGLD